jgi:hypothetical protein
MSVQSTVNSPSIGSRLPRLVLVSKTLGAGPRRNHNLNRDVPCKDGASYRRPLHRSPFIEPLGFYSAPLLLLPLATQSPDRDGTYVFHGCCAQRSPISQLWRARRILAVTFSDVLLTYCAQSSSGVAGCSCGSLTQVPGSAGAATASSDVLPLTVTSGERLGLGAGCEYPERYHCEWPDYFSGAPSSTTDLGSGQLVQIYDLYRAVSNVSPGAVASRRIEIDQNARRSAN